MAVRFASEKRESERKGEKKRGTGKRGRPWQATLQRGKKGF